ncbi:MAG: hypothetical protein CVT63_03365 [Candidatus Anoxymicrobium japonicum]|uniref:Uncharacterized protein n=1 Tax=Candidatus Anoxymicrobium japonicum TaxID=2013648 RepID=A0A2N3G6I3_9ACTN|nr:MAG: hypothetical protein CVT63_03365 [Candidatus Anoxymicrobium japonicum]
MVDEKKLLPVNMRELCWALDDSSFTINRYLDLETGEIVEQIEFDDAYYDDNEEELEDPVSEMIEEDPDRFEYIDPLPSFESYRHMEAFIPTVQDPHLKDLFVMAIDGRGAFKRFKDVLNRYPEEEERWSQFKERKMMCIAMDFLDSIGVEPVGDRLRGATAPDGGESRHTPGEPCQ